MKTLPLIKVVAFIAIAALIPSCITQTVIDDPAEHYIKTKVEEHDPGHLSTVRILPLLTVTAINTTTDLQFTGYKYHDEKKLVICVRPFKMANGTKTYDTTEFVELTVAEAQAIVDNYKRLEEKVLLEMPKEGEYVYHDYTVNSQLFISYRGTLNPFMKKVVGPTALDFWINSVKYAMPTTEVIGKVQAFLNY